jgi:hypothetical protein
MSLHLNLGMISEETDVIVRAEEEETKRDGDNKE